MVPESLLAPVVVEPEKDVGLSDELCVRMISQNLSQPIKHKSGRIDDLDIVMSEWVDSIQRDQHQVVSQHRVVVSTLQPVFLEICILGQRCIPWHLVEEYCLQLTIVLFCGLNSIILNQR